MVSDENTATMDIIRGTDTTVTTVTMGMQISLRSRKDNRQTVLLEMLLVSYFFTACRVKQVKIKGINGFCRW